MPVVVRDNVTIAGQTAPGGFAVYGQQVSYSGVNNAITRHLAIRKGVAGLRVDSVSMASGSNNIFDPMFVTWGVDETFSMNVSTGATIENITIRNTIIGRGLDRLGHSPAG
jgi:hypothetical protein